MSFQLLETFQKKTKICDLKLSTVIMEDKQIPWILLIPRIENVTQINQLNIDNQLQLMKEINASSCIMESLFECDRLNVAAIGNKTPQLHVHIICRTKDDPFWPETVWGQKIERLTQEENSERATKLIEKFKALIID